MQAAELRDWIKQGLFKGKRVVGVIPTEGLIAKHLQVESIPGLDVSLSALTMAAEQLDLPADRIVHRCFEVALVRTGGVLRKEVVSFCSPRKLVERLVASMQRVGLDLVGLHAAPVGLAKTFADLTNDSVLVVELGARQASATVLDDGRISVVRFAPQGMDVIDHAIAASLGVSVDRARAARERHGGLEASGIASRLENPLPGGLVEITPASGGVASSGAPVVSGAAAPVSGTDPKSLHADQAVAEVVDELCEELMIAVRYHRGVFPSKRVSRVVFTGGGARCLDLCRRIAERLGVAAQLGDPLAGAERLAGIDAVGVDLSEPTPAFSAAFGVRTCPVDL
ncbi:MAG: hypothetical protein AAF108_01945 [Planctomycetota bacterium]